METKETTAVFLSPADALMFVEFQKRYSLIKLLDSLKVFDIRSGSVTIHFNPLGEIGSIDRLQHYRP